MAKASTPIRIQDQLFQAAVLHGRAAHRSATQQLEYWAELGRTVSAELAPELLVKVRAGLARLRVDHRAGPALSPDEVFGQLDSMRAGGELEAAIKQSNRVRYQLSEQNPGMLEQISPSGARVIGQFENGCFVPASPK